jgi:hypothetical protein
LAAAPRDELLRFVPEDVGFCLVVQDLRGHAAAFLNSPFVEQLRESALGESIRKAKEFGDLVEIDKQLKNRLGMTGAQLRDDIFGDAIVIAYRPGPPGKPEEEQELILLRARTAKALADLIDAIHKESPAPDERAYAGTKYFRRVEGRKESFYLVRGPILVYSGQEDVLRRAIDCEAKAAPDAEPPVAKQLRLLGVDRALMAVWINPRAFDAELESKLKQVGQESPAHLAALTTFSTYWKALDSVGVALALEKEFSLSVAVRARTDQLPASARRFLAEASKPSELWARFPDNALVAAAGRFDLGAFFEVVGEFLTKETRQKLRGQLTGLGAALDLDFVKDVLPSIGPDWGFCLTAPAATDKSWVPSGVVAVRVSPGNKTAPLDRTLFSALKSFATVLVAAHNGANPDQPVNLKTVIQDKTEILYLSSSGGFAAGLPPGFQPAFALQAGYLVLATSPDAVRRLAAPTSLAPDPAAEFPLLRVSLKDWRTYLREKREPLAAALAAKNQLGLEEARQSLDRVIAGLQFVDLVEIGQRTTKGQVTLTLHLRTNQPLRK